MNTTGIDPRAAREAAQWLVRLQTEGNSAARQAGLHRWLSADPRHEAAWQRAQQVVAQIGLAGAGPLGGAGASALRQAGLARRRTATRLLAAAILAGPATLAAWRLAPWSNWSADLRTATGEQRSVTLPDGGHLLLDTASAADIAYSPDARRIVLHAGAVQVQTAGDPLGRPFLVQTPQGSAWALGTRFTVRIDDTMRPATTRVAVTQGAVELRPALGAPPVHIGAGQQAHMDGSGAGMAGALDPLADGWTEGVLYAEKMPLGRFAAELGRYRPGLLRCDPAVAHLPVSGAFQLADTDAALHALAASLPIRIELRTRWWVSIGPM